MPNERLDELLAKLPEIARVVNDFKSENLQERAFDAIMRTMDVPTVPDRPGVDAGEDVADVGEQKTPVTPGSRRAASRNGQRRRESELRFIKDLNLRPSGKQSLKAFREEKAPGTNEETYAVVIYYLEKVLELQSITVDHVFTALKDFGDFRVSPRLRTILSNTGSNKGWFDASNKDAIKLSIHGENLIEHDLPRPKAKAAK